MNYEGMDLSAVQLEPAHKQRLRVLFIGSDEGVKRAVTGGAASPQIGGTFLGDQQVGLFQARVHTCSLEQNGNFGQGTEVTKCAKKC